MPTKNARRPTARNRSIDKPAGQPGTRDRVLFATAELFRRQGYAATGMKQIVADADAPFGSLYHFFPGGKEELGAEVIRMAGGFFQKLFADISRNAPDPVSAMHQFFAGAAQTLKDTDYADACPIATVALETASTSEPLRQATADVFSNWIEAGTTGLIRAGLSPASAREITVSMIMSLEGGFILSRSMRTTEPLEIAGQMMVERLERALAERR